MIFLSAFVSHHCESHHCLSHCLCGTIIRAIITTETSDQLSKMCSYCHVESPSSSLDLFHVGIDSVLIINFYPLCDAMYLLEFSSTKKSSATSFTPQIYILLTVRLLAPIKISSIIYHLCCHLVMIIYLLQK